MEGGLVENKQVLFKNYIQGRAPMESDMELKLENKIEVKVPEGSGALLVKKLYLSCDPYMRGRMRFLRFLYSPFSAWFGFGVSKVIDSDDPNFKPGDMVLGMTGWEEYSLIKKTDQLRKSEQDNDVGFYKVCEPKTGESVFVSAASGAVGKQVIHV